MFPSSNSHVRIAREQTTDDNENRNSRTGRFLDKFKVGNSNKRTSSNDGSGASPFSLAQRLRTLLDAHPVNSPAPRFQSLPTPETSPSPPSPVAGPSESSISSPTVFFSAPSSPADAELAALLSSPILPNSVIPLPGTFDVPPVASPPTPLSPSRHQTVFNILDRIGSPRARARRLSRVTDDGRQSIHASPRVWPASPAMSSISSVLASGSVTAAYGSDGIREIEEETTDDDDDDDTSIMMYSPLMPTPASLVSIAESEISVVAVHEESEDEEETEPVQYTLPPPPPAPEPHPPEQTQTSSWGIKLWPFSSWFSSSSQNANSTPANSNQVEPPAATPRAQRSVVPVSRPTSTQVRLRRRRVWVPSRTQLSLETMWWGYRIYIPPPILEALDSTSLETTRRAALLTAALTWFFTNFPVHVLPITVRPVIILLQGLVPYLGYLGSILSWSWGSIRSYDEGYGIILTATWLVPIALIPSTWVPPPSEWPGSPLSSQTTPTFSTLSSISHSTSPTLSQSTMTPTPMPPSSLPSSPSLLPQQELSPEPPQGQLYPIYSPAFVYQSPYSPASSLPLTQQYTQEPLDQAQQQGQPYPVYSPYSQTTMLSPLTQLSASFPSPPMNFSSFGYAYGHPFPTTSQTPPIMAMSMTSPIQTNGAVMFSPAMMPMSVTSSSSSSPYTSSSAALTPTPAPASALPITSTSSMSQRRSRKREGSLYAPRMATVPLPTEDR